MTLTQLAQKHNLEPESAKAFLREWLDSQDVHGYVGSIGGLYRQAPPWSATPLIARPTDLGD